MSDRWNTLRCLFALPLFLLGSLLQLAAVYIGGERFAAICLDSLKKRAADV